MDLQFRSTPKPPAKLIERVSACDPNNPFHTSAYLSAIESLGQRAHFVGLCRADEVVSGCIAFVSGTFLRRSLNIPSLPSISSPEIFWRGLLGLCRDLRVWRLQIDTYASPPGSIPQLPGELARRTRCEYVLDLDRDHILEGASSQHRRNISRAAKAGLSIHRAGDAAACARHLELSMLPWNGGPIAVKKSRPVRRMPGPWRY